MKRFTRRNYRSRSTFFLRDARFMVNSLFALMLLAMVINASHAETVQTPYGASSVEFKLHKAPDLPVYYVVGLSDIPTHENQGHTSNAGFVVTNDGVVVYDALGTPALGYRLLQAIRSITEQPVRIVVAGHYHADHIYGLQAFKEHTNAEIWAHRDSALYLQSENLQKRLQQRRQALAPWIDETTYVVKPDKTYSERQTITMGNTELELIHVGTAHTPDDTVLVIRNIGVIFAGDLVFGGRLPFLAGEHVNTQHWLTGLDDLERLRKQTRFIVPGHGVADANPADSINLTREYISFLRKVMGEAVNDFTSFSEVFDTTDWSAFRNMPTYDDTHRRNAHQVFLEMEAELLSGSKTERSHN